MVRQKPVLSLVQEPWCNGNLVRDLDAAGGWVYVTMGEIVPKTCVVVRGVEGVFRQDYFTRDLAVVSIRDDATVDGSGPLIGMEVPPPEVRKLVNFDKREGYGLIVGCDSNAHFHIWGSTNDNPREEELLEYLLGTDLEILNECMEPNLRHG